jgi:hypothetical protein
VLSSTKELLDVVPPKLIVADELALPLPSQPGTVKLADIVFVEAFVVSVRLVGEIAPLPSVRVELCDDLSNEEIPPPA